MMLAADIGNAALTRQGSMTAPALIQYAWRNPERPILYVAFHQLRYRSTNPTASIISPPFGSIAATGALGPFGASVAIRARPINITVDAAGKVAADSLQRTQHHDRPSARSGRRDR